MRTAGASTCRSKRIRHSWGHQGPSGAAGPASAACGGSCEVRGSLRLSLGPAERSGELSRSEGTDIVCTMHEPCAFTRVVTLSLAAPGPHRSGRARCPAPSQQQLAIVMHSSPLRSFVCHLVASYDARLYQQHRNIVAYHILSARLAKSLHDVHACSFRGAPVRPRHHSRIPCACGKCSSSSACNGSHTECLFSKL
jgi:hypothetical protein